MIILNILLRYYKDMFARIWIFSPSIKLDPQYAPLRKYLEKMADPDKEPLMFEDLNQKALGKILDDQRAIVESCRKRKVKPPQVCLILDDLGDQGEILNSRRGGKSGGSWLTTLACRSRHLCLTWVVSVQKLNQCGLTLRCNTRSLCCWRLRNQKEIEILCEEMSGFYPKDVIMDLYHHATAEPYSFLFVRLDAKTRRDAFWLRFETRLIPQDADSKDDGDVHGPGAVDGGPREPVEKQRPGPSQVRPPGGAGKGGSKGAEEVGRNPVRKNLRPRKPAL
jgi:hypothetical protein